MDVLRRLRKQAPLLRVTVVGSSMEPTLHHGQRLVVRRTGLRRLRPGQLVVFDNPTALEHPRLLVKRLHAVGPSVVAGERPVTIGADECFVLGDAPSTQDSRVFGPIPRDSIRGVVLPGLSSR
ncbi:S26 family signal peptidase [Pimelobacter simplex]|uniref:S26 family signal peptidase n=1 Tax=Nocardioides simplex TaxID=2045 RepID=UPI003AAC07C7